jgi:hypothetical protein
LFVTFIPGNAVRSKDYVLPTICYGLDMTTLLGKALEKVEALSQDEQDAIASQILDSLADEKAWKKRFAAKRDRLRLMAQEALDEDDRGETRPLDNLL